MLEQIAIGLCGVAAVFLSQDSRAARSRYACVFGLIAQPFWFIATWKAQQYGIFALCILYTAAWTRGFVTHWVRPFYGR
jgi:hypothetical protein